MSLLSSLKQITKKTLLPPYCRLRYGGWGRYLAQARLIEGWTTPAELVELAKVSQALPNDPVIVEIGSFLGRSTVLFAGVRKLRGNGKVHAIDPFDGSGDIYSIPIYHQIANKLKMSLFERFYYNIHNGELLDWIEVHQGTAETVVPSWTQPIDLLFLDGDQSPEGVRSAYEQWSPFLKLGGVIVVHNSGDRHYEPDHDGHRRLVVETIRSPQYKNIYCVGSTTFAYKVSKNSLKPLNATTLSRIV